MTEWTGNHPETLAGVRVVDLSRLLPGPFASMLLADLGADVIKIEDPNGGDYARWFPPHYEAGSDKMGVVFASLNRGKRCLAMNLKKDAGKDVFRELIKTADVLLESFRPGVMERLGLSPDELRALNPGLVYCAISGFGQDGPFHTRAGHDLNYLGIAGVVDQNGTADGGPRPPGFQLADVAGGSLYAALSIVAALFRREKSGKGATLDISMTEGALTFMAPLFGRIVAGEEMAERGRDQLTGGLPCYRTYRTSDDKYVTLGALEPKFWMAFCNAVGKPNWVSGGHSNTSPLHGEVEELFASRTRDEWVAEFSGLDFCFEPVLTAQEALESELMKARQVFFTLGAASQIQSLQTSTPVTPKVSQLSLQPPPKFGEHSHEVLTSLGLGEDEIAILVADGIVRLA